MILNTPKTAGAYAPRETVKTTPLQSRCSTRSHSLGVVADRPTDSILKRLLVTHLTGLRNTG